MDARFGLHGTSGCRMSLTGTIPGQPVVQAKAARGEPNWLASAKSIHRDGGQYSVDVLKDVIKNKSGEICDRQQGTIPTTKQIGDAYEILAAARLTFAGLPANVMPDGWPDCDLIVQPPNERSQRISVEFGLSRAVMVQTHLSLAPTPVSGSPSSSPPQAESERNWMIPVDLARDLSSPGGSGQELPLAHLDEKSTARKDKFTLLGEDYNHRRPG